jgi:3-oxoacyl-[acyl-carrier protein] reductase
MNLERQTQRTALVTGSTRGIGKETALLLLQKEFNVIISSRSQQSIDNVIQEIHDKFPSKKENILVLKCDVSQQSDVKSLVDISIKHSEKLIFLLITQV